MLNAHLDPAAVEEHPDRDDHNEEHHDGGGCGADERRKRVVVSGGDGVPGLYVGNRCIGDYSDLK